jgi:hypothetical protein
MKLTRMSGRTVLADPALVRYRIAYRLTMV